MMDDIRNLLQKVHNDLKGEFDKYDESSRRNFKIKMNRHLINGVGEYGGLFQNVYILQYLLAYGFEQSFIYKTILKDMNEERENISVTSIGAGTGIDYWGLCYALKEIGYNNTTIGYKGVEPENWKYRIDKRENDTMVFPDDIRNFGQLLGDLENTNRLDDVYFFPHSIKEVCENTEPENNRLLCMARFAGILHEKIYGTDRKDPVYIAFSYRTWPGYGHDRNNDAGKGLFADKTDPEMYDTYYGTYLIDALCAMGFSCELLCDENRYFELKSFENTKESAYFFGAPEGNVMCGKDSIRISEAGSVFNKIIIDDYHDNGFIDPEEWESYCDKHPISNTTMFCYQVFRVSRPDNESEESINRYDQVVSKAKECYEILKSYDGEIEDRSYTFNDFNDFRSNTLLDRLPQKYEIRENFQNFMFDDENKENGLLVRKGKDTTVTERGKKFGWSSDKLGRTIVYSAFYKSFFANIASGRFLLKDNKNMPAVKKL